MKTIFQAFTGAIIAVTVFICLATLIGRQLHGVYGEAELGSTPLPVGILIILFWLGVSVAFFIGMGLGLRFGRASMKAGKSE